MYTRRRSGLIVADVPFSKVTENTARIPAGTENGYDYPISIGGSLQQYDVVVGTNACDGSPAVFYPQEATGHWESGDALPRMSAWYIILGASPISAFTLGYDVTYPQSVVWQVWRGINASDPVNATFTSNFVADPGPGVAPGITTDGDGCLIFQFLGIDDEGNTGGIALTGYTNLLAEYAVNAGTNSSTSAMCSKTQTSAGTENAGSWAHTATDDVWAAAIAFNP